MRFHVASKRDLRKTISFYRARLEVQSNAFNRLVERSARAGVTIARLKRQVGDLQVENAMLRSLLEERRDG